LRIVGGYVFYLSTWTDNAHYSINNVTKKWGDSEWLTPYFLAYRGWNVLFLYKKMECIAKVLAQKETPIIMHAYGLNSCPNSLEAHLRNYKCMLF
jgi:hypothetical protein